LAEKIIKKCLNNNKKKMVVVFLINKNCFFGDKYYRGAYSKPHRQSQEVKAAFDRNDTTYIDWQQRLQINPRLPLAKWLETYVCSHTRGSWHTIGTDKLYREANMKGRLRRFRSTGLPRALKELERLGIIARPRIRKDGKVTWFRPEA